jgi:hypothetical protein
MRRLSLETSLTSGLEAGVASGRLEQLAQPGALAIADEALAGQVGDPQLVVCREPMIAGVKRCDRERRLDRPAGAVP